MSDDLKAPDDDLVEWIEAWMADGGAPGLAKEIRRWTARLRAAKPAVRVKALEWGSEEGLYWVAHTGFGIYSVEWVEFLKAWAVRMTWRAGINGRQFIHRNFDTLEAARAACQAHYEAAILSALDAAPEPPGDHIAEAGKMVEPRIHKVSAQVDPDGPTDAGAEMVTAEPSKDAVERVAEAIARGLSAANNGPIMLDDVARAAIKALGR